MNDRQERLKKISQIAVRLEAKRLDKPASWELKRRLVEILLAGIRVETVQVHAVKRAR